ncbi:hypothetical protein DFQ28_001591 [Apophysomyces sp. BC1034]|nr:hypothetical protein DFQ30_008026 [Apophysomyces sp. BC1015]KAG0178432.1 hypothetical protein DFQ29_003475 [Apophysomyces sp. BC1021]KAG0194099.1 hypothetical protein DFQ28_001591 [Apophysomyces sp. BC1034]
MGLKPQTIALLTAGVAVTAGIGYMVYFDQKRRNDPKFRKQLKRERKKVAKATKVAEEQAKHSTVQLIEAVLEAASKEPLPTTPEEKEKYFMAQVGAGEAFYDQAILPFYMALKVYPAPMELIMIYQKTVPAPVFQIVVQLMALEQQKRQSAFYEQFPPKSSNVKLGEVSDAESEARRALLADKDIKEGETIFIEAPVVSALHPAFEGLFCNFCLAKVNETKVECAECSHVVFCSDVCKEKANVEYHKYLCAKDKVEDASEKEASAFVEFSKQSNRKYPLMIARFLSTMVAEEVAKNQQGNTEDTYNSWDHVDRFKYLETAPSADSNQEIELLKALLGPKVQGISEFLTDEIYLMLKGKLLYNAYAVKPTEDVEAVETDELMRETKDNDRPSIGAALYKISTYIGQSEDAYNTQMIFRDNHEVAVIATKDIKEGEELTASYAMPTPKE